jgi:type I restriction enzyme S subunit
MNEAVRISVGSLSPTINWGTLKNCEFDLPPMEEQKKLAELLWAANDLKEKYKKAIAATDEMLKAKFREMFGNPVQESIHTLDEMIYDLRYGISQPPQFDELGTYKFIRATNIEKGKIVEKDMLKIADSEQERVAKCRLKGREVIIVRSGANAGDSSYIPESYAGSFAGYDIIVCIDESKADPQYIAFVLAMPEYFRSKIKPMTARTAQPHINAEQVRSLSMPFPPLALQRKFVAIAEKAEAAKASLKKSIADIDQVMKGLINNG